MNSPLSVGDKAVYPVHGVAEVVAHETRTISGVPTSVYILKILDTGMTIMVPTSNAAAVGLRGIISDEEAADVLSMLREKGAARDGQTWNRRYREYMEKIKSGSVFEIAEVVRDLCVLKAEKTLSFGERRMLEMARALVVKEIALAKKTSEHAIDAEIDEIFQAAA